MAGLGDTYGASHEDSQMFREIHRFAPISPLFRKVDIDLL